MRKRICFLALPSIALFGMNGLFADTPKPAQQTTQKSTPLQEYTPKNYDKLIGNTAGIGDDVLKMHFKLYEGYVANTNKLLKKIQELNDKGDNRSPEYAGLKRMFGWEYDGMRLHEYYFDNLGGKTPLDMSSPLGQQIAEEFGSYDKWKADFIATGLMRGIGWVVLYKEPQQGRLINEWINEHDLGHIAGGTPLLIMDVFEHAYITQYGLDRAGYVDAFFNNIDWGVVAQRYSPLSR